MKRAATCLLLISPWGLACASPPAVVDLEAESEAVLQADRDFAADTAARGVEGWVSYFAEDGVMPPAMGAVIQGHAAIREVMAPAFERPGYTMDWTPEFAEVSKGGDLAYTYGTYEFSSTGPEGERLVTRGRYVTVWRKQPDGVWKVALDMGNIAQDGQE